jgi:uncharacterized membrane protein YphA (DoxX/SURF4 family)
MSEPSKTAEQPDLRRNITAGRRELRDILAEIYHARGREWTGWPWYRWATAAAIAIGLVGGGALLLVHYLPRLPMLVLALYSMPANVVAWPCALMLVANHDLRRQRRAEARQRRGDAQ